MTGTNTVALTKAAIFNLRNEVMELFFNDKPFHGKLNYLKRISPTVGNEVEAEVTEIIEGGC